MLIFVFFFSSSSHDRFIQVFDVVDCCRFMFAKCSGRDASVQGLVSATTATTIEDATLSRDHLGMPAYKTKIAIKRIAIKRIVRYIIAYAVAYCLETLPLERRQEIVAQIPKDGGTPLDTCANWDINYSTKVLIAEVEADKRYFRREKNRLSTRSKGFRGCGIGYERRADRHHSCSSVVHSDFPR